MLGLLFFGGVVAFWKSLGKLLHGVVKKWLSRDVSFGFWYLVSLRDTELETAALEAIDNALRCHLPLRVARVHIRSADVSAGPVFGLRAIVAGLTVELEWLGPGDWDQAAEAIREAARGSGALEAAAKIALVKKQLQPQGPLSSAPAMLVERLATGAKVELGDLWLLFRQPAATVLGPEAAAGETPARLHSRSALEVCGSLSVNLANCWKIELGGSLVRAAMTLGIRVHGEDVLSPVPMSAQLELPRILRTLLQPRPLPNKRVHVEASVGALKLGLEPQSVRELTCAMASIGAFGRWKHAVEQEVHGVLVPLPLGDLDAYRSAVVSGRSGENVKYWESRMTCADILQCHCEALAWPVPDTLSVEEWLAVIADEQKPIRTLAVVVSFEGLAIELRGRAERPGDGLKFKLVGAFLRADLRDATSLAADGPPPLAVDLNVVGLEVLCDPKIALAVPVLAPCELSLNYAKRSPVAVADDEDSIQRSLRSSITLQCHLRTPPAAPGADAAGQGAEGSEAVVVISAHALWRISGVLEDLQAARPPPDTDEASRRDTLKEQQAKVKEERRLREVRQLFEALDTDRSGKLEEPEVYQLLESMYGRHMTLQELRAASQQLFRLLAVDDEGVSLERLQSFLVHRSGVVAQETVCLRLKEFRRPVPQDLQPLTAFRKMLASEDLRSIETPVEVLQLRWVRTLRNYEVARKEWEKSIAPELAGHFRLWRLRPSTWAVDFWSDPTFSLSLLSDEASRSQPSSSLDLDVSIAGISLRLADSQHFSATPRVQAKLSNCLVKGSLETLPGRTYPRFRQLNGEAQMKAWYFNDKTQHNEPLIEPWRLHLQAEGDRVAVHAYQHLVVNVTPPLLHALSVVAGSLQVGQAESSAVAKGAPAARVIAWIVNRTGCDIVVTATGPMGKSHNLPLFREHGGTATPIKLQEEVVAAKQASKRWYPHFRGSGDQQEHQQRARTWSLAVTGGEGEESWALAEAINFSVTGHRIAALTGDGGRLLAVDVSVDVHSPAPVVTLSGITTVKNLTTLPVLVEGAGFHHECPPGGAIPTCIGGDVQLSLPAEVAVGGAVLTVAVPSDTASFPKPRKVLKQQGNVRFVWKSEGDRRFVFCAPRLRLFNGLPCEVRFRAGCPAQKGSEESYRAALKRIYRRGLRVAAEAVEGGEEPEESGASVEPEPERLQSLTPGAASGLDQADPDGEVELILEVGPNRYTLHLPAAVLNTERNAVKFQRQRKNGKINYFHLQADDTDAPHLDLDLVWQDHSAVIVVYARYWLANKTGWHLDVASGSKLPGRRGVILQDYEETSPAPLTGAPWEVIGGEGAAALAAAGAAPELALLHAGDEVLQLRLCGTPSESHWCWDEKRAGGTTISHWTHSASAGWQTGWSADVSVAMSGTTGVAELPGLTPEELEKLAPPPEEAEEPQAQAVGAEDGAEREAEGDGVVPAEEGSSLGAQALADALSRGVGSAAEQARAAEVAAAQGTLDAMSSLRRLAVTTTDGVVVGVAVENLLAPFQRTKLVTVVPRYILRNDLDEAVDLWPALATSRLPPLGSAPEGPTVQPDCALAIDAVPQDGMLAVVRGARPPSTMVSIRIAAPRASADEAEDRAASQGWSVQIPLSAVGDTVFTLGTGTRDDPFRVVRASVQLIGATLFVILVKSRWPFCIENRSQLRSVVFQFPGEDTSHEWRLMPCERRYFVFPDPDAPRQVIGRISGAGADHVVRYNFQSLTSEGAPDLYVPGHSTPALKASFRDRGSTRVLVLHDAHSGFTRELSSLQVAQEEEEQQPEQSVRRSSLDEGHAEGQDAAGTANAAPKDPWLAVDVCLAGLHLCLVDTSTTVPQELLAVTVDYLQLTSSPKDKEIALSVHNFQIDDFAQEDGFVIGPSNSGLNSQRNALSESSHFHAEPLLEMRLIGPRNKQTPVFDHERNMLTLGQVDVCLRPLEALLDVTRIVNIAYRLQDWMSAVEKRSDDIHVARAALAAALVPGFSTPQRGGETSCYIHHMNVTPINFASDLRLKTRSKVPDEEDGEEDLETRLMNLGAGSALWLRPLINFLARLGSSFAEAAPKFKFSRLQLHHVTGNVAVVRSSVGKHYQQQLLAQSARVLGSLQVLGDPANLLDDISGGFTTFLRKTKEEMTGERAGLGAGVGDLAEGVVGGALSSVSKIAGSLKDTAGSLAGRPVGDHSRAKDLQQGLTLALGSLAGGVTEAVNGLVEEPVSQAATGGAFGLLKGCAQGGAGLVLRPIEGIFGAVEKFAEGAEGQVRGLTSGYNGLRRPPRLALASGEGGLQALPAPLFWPEWSLRVLRVSLPALWRDRRVTALALTLAGARELWSEAEAREVVIIRRAEQDGWALAGSGDEHVMASGRVGLLRGPFRLQVWAFIETNLELAQPLRVLAGEGVRPTDDLAAALAQPLGKQPSPIIFQVLASPPPPSGPPLGALAEGAVLGEVHIELAPWSNPKIMPRRYVPELAEASQASTADVDAAGDASPLLAKIGPEAATASAFEPRP